MVLFRRRALLYFLPFLVVAFGLLFFTREESSSIHDYVLQPFSNPKPPENPPAAPVNSSPPESSPPKSSPPTPLNPSPTKPSLPSPSQDDVSADPLKEDFITASMKVEIPQFDISVMQDMCSGGEAGGPWPTDLVFQCSYGVGGLNSVRQQILACIRLAIEYKAALVMPSFRPRLETNSTEGVVHEYTGSRGLDVLFDSDNFQERLSSGCPQMTIYKDVFSIPAPVERVNSTINFVKNPTRERMQASRIQWFEEHPASNGTTRLVQVRRNAGQYVACTDSAEFANSFGQILTYREDTRRLGAAVLYQLSQRYNLSLDPSKDININSFLGIHLRTASDAVKVGWISYEEQATLYKKFADSYKLPVIYVASGNLSSTELFRDAVYPIPVVTKTSLLSGKELADLNALSWDQQAEVDYYVLLRSSQFLGMTNSGFSWAVAVARRARDKGTCSSTEEDEEKIVKEGLGLRDGLSVIIGGVSQYPFSTKSWP